MPKPELLQRIAALQGEGVAFALATVVARKAPVSSHLGDAAIVFEDGRIQGYIGGGCSQEILRMQALQALRSGEPRLVRISPDDIPGLPGYPSARPDDDQYVRVRMTCASQGAVDLYVEPYAALPLLVVVGAMPIAAAIADQAALVGFDVLRVREPEERGAEGNLSLERFTGPAEELPARIRTRQVLGVVASMGEYDDVGLDQLLRLKAPYVALVASRPRCAAVLDSLRSRGWTDDDLAVVHSPAGLDIGAKTAPEVALSILAEIVRWRRSRKTQAAPIADTAVDPVCGMHVSVTGAAHVLKIEGETRYFCSSGCERAFADAALSKPSGR
ncbi:MAG: XdhC family protein [Candidatus Eremiobacteraeota bacterium]|nr:XdhC family protein [Candidatus Eremiobacteraeota bacterium]